MNIFERSCVHQRRGIRFVHQSNVFVPLCAPVCAPIDQYVHRTCPVHNECTSLSFNDWIAEVLSGIARILYPRLPSKLQLRFYSKICSHSSQKELEFSAATYQAGQLVLFGGRLAVLHGSPSLLVMVMGLVWQLCKHWSLDMRRKNGALLVVAPQLNKLEDLICSKTRPK